MTNEQIIEALGEWLAETVPDVAGRIYTAAPANKDLGLPDALIVLLAEEAVLDAAQFPTLAALQQLDGYTLRFGISFMVEVGTDVESEQAADAIVRGYAETLKRAVRSDKAAIGPRELLGSRPSFDYDPPFAQYPDGTRGREMTMQLAVAQVL